MRKILSSLLFTMTCFAAFSQDDFLLKNFKYRVNHYRAMNFNIGGGGNYAQLDLEPTNHEASNFSGMLSATYYALKSTDRKLSSASAGFFTNFSSGRSDDQYGFEKARNFQVTPVVTFLTRHFTAKNNFLEWGGNISCRSVTAKNSSTMQTNNRNTDLSHYAVTLNTGIGNGRLENVTDMQNALWLNKAIAKANRLSRPLTPEELDGLGRSITKGNNTRVLDGRKRTQFILETVDAYMQQHGLVNTTDIKYFTNLNDILFFAFNNPRLSGVEKFIRFSPSISGRNENIDMPGLDQKIKTTFDVQAAVLDIGFGAYVPANLVHQNNYGASLRGSYLSGNYTDRPFANGNPVSEFKSETGIKKAGINLFYQHSFYPSTRTTINLELQTENGYHDADNSDGFYNTSSLAASASYFISYRTRFNFKAGGNYQNILISPQGYNITETDNIRLFANAGLDISL